MHTPRRRSLAYLALGVSAAAFAGAAAASLHQAPLVTVLLLAQAIAVVSVGWIIRDARRSHLEVAAMRADLATVQDELSHLDEHCELIAARTERLARLLEVQKVVRPSGPDREATGEIVRMPAGPRRIR